MHHLTFSGGILDSNGCVRKWNTTVTGYSETERPVESLDECSSACKEELTCEVFSYQEEGRNCTLFSGDATIEQQSGNGTVGFCLPGNSVLSFSLNFHISNVYLKEERPKNCHLKLRFKMDQDNSRRLYQPTFASTTTTSQCAEACSMDKMCSGFSFDPLPEDYEKCRLFSESVFTEDNEGTQVVGWCPKGN